MKAMEVLRRPFLFLWAFLRPSRLPRCPRCDKELGALDERHERVCPRRCETCGCRRPGEWIVDTSDETCAWCRRRDLWVPYSSWCRDWVPRTVKP